MGNMESLPLKCSDVCSDVAVITVDRMTNPSVADYVAFARISTCSDEVIKCEQKT